MSEEDTGTVVPETVTPTETTVTSENTDVTEIKEGDQAAKEESAPQGYAPEGTEPKKAKGVQKRIDELTRTIYQERREKEQLMEMLKGQIQPQSQPQQDNAPKLENFDSYDDFIDAKINYQAAKIAEQKFIEVDEQKRLERDKQSNEVTARQWSSNVEKARDKYDDFDEVVNNDSVPVSFAMSRAIIQSDIGTDIAYYLGKNPQEAIRISNLDPFASAREIGRIEAKLVSAPTPKKPSSAPDPITPIGNNEKANRDPEKMSITEWMAHRKAEVKKKRGY